MISTLLPQYSMRTLVGAICVAMSLGGTAHAEPIGASTSAAIVTDGKIAFIKSHDIITINPDGSGRRTITTGRDFAPVWSPDGTKIAYVHVVDKGRDLYVMNADGTRPSRVTSTGKVSKGGASWSPDGSQLAFGGPCIATQAEPHICHGLHHRKVLDLISATAHAEAPVTVSAQDTPQKQRASHVFDRVSWNSNGDDIAFASDGFRAAEEQYVEVYSFSTDVISVEVAVGHGSEFGELANAAFSPDGLLLGYDEYRFAGTEEFQGIQLCDFPRGACGLFVEDRGDEQLAFAPAQDRVVFVRHVYPQRVVVAKLDGTDRSLLVRGNQPSWQTVLAN